MKEAGEEGRKDRRGGGGGREYLGRWVATREGGGSRLDWESYVGGSFPERRRGGAL